jgi:transcriptional regulator with XRE-family HTH domain
MGTRRKPKSGKVGHYIKEWRKHRHLTQEQLAGRLGVATSSVSQLETGKQGYSQATLEALAEALSCEAWQLISVDPTKEGEVIDLMRLIDDRNREQAIRVLKALTGTS